MFVAGRRHPASNHMVHFDKFLYFVQLQLETGDYDAHIPFWQNYALGWDPEDRVWLAVLYMAYYNEASAHLAFHSQKINDYPIELQRRNLYGGRIHTHLDDMKKLRPLHEWFGRAENWCHLLDLVGDIWGNGRWATYTSAELIMHMARMQHIEPDRFEIQSSSGPRQGLEYLEVTPTEAGAHYVLQELRREGCELSVSQCESLLCDWAGMNKGTFYAGRNIDRQQGRIEKVANQFDADYRRLYKIRKEAFPESTLGELNGWHGIDKDRLSVYQRTGRVLAPSEER